MGMAREGRSFGLPARDNATVAIGLGVQVSCLLVAIAATCEVAGVNRAAGRAVAAAVVTPAPSTIVVDSAAVAASAPIGV